MSTWPETRMTLLDRLSDPRDQEAWTEFVDLYGPLLYHFARRRLPQDEDAADVLQAVLGAVLKGTYQRPGGRFQKWLVTVETRLRPMKDVRVRRVRQVVPEIRDVPQEEAEERNLVARLGTLQGDLSSRYILDLDLPRRPDGKYAVAQLELSYDVGTGRRETSPPIPLEICYTAASHGHVNAEVMKHIDEINLKEMSDILQAALEKGDQQSAERVAQEMVKQGELMGKRAEKKTQLARNVLDELNANGCVRRQTQLALESEARVAEPCGQLGSLPAAPA